MSGTLNRWGHYFLGLQYFDLILAGRLIPKPEDSFRSHLVWAKRRDVNLKALITGRCLTSTVVLSLMVSTDVAIIYSPSKPADVIRDALENERVDTLAYWVGITVCVSVSASFLILI